MHYFLNLENKFHKHNVNYTKYQLENKNSILSNLQHIAMLLQRSSNIASTFWQCCVKVQ